MSKQRPSASRLRRPGAAGGAWRRRVFQNTYTRDGRLIKVSGWSVKIQFKGRRRTFSLSAARRDDAAREAAALHQKILAQGWSAASPEGGDQGLVKSRRPGPPGKPGVSDWKNRLIHRKHREAALTAENDYSVRIEHEGAFHYFQLGTEYPEEAAAGAREIHETIVNHGWPAAFQRFPREITVAIFWATSPVACTYTTLFTFADSEPARPVAPYRRARWGRNVFLVEADATIRRTLAFWLNKQPGFHCPAVFESTQDAMAVVAHHPPDLLLVNRDLPENPVAEFMDQLHSSLPGLPAYTYGVYPDSDHIFVSLSGVMAGYILRRRTPTHLFEPIQDALRQKVLSTGNIQTVIRAYFQSLFGADRAADETPGLANLTAREQETLSFVSKGYLDKEIANALGISIWTVHNHLKNIYEKLGVHTRTEAVLKYLHK